VKPDISPRLTKVIVEFAGKRRPFKLDCDRLCELQDITGFGPWMIQKRLLSGECGPKEVTETIRLGMEGAGDSPTEAEKTTERQVRQRPLEENRLVAFAIISAALVGVKDEAIKKAPGEGTSRRNRLSPTESSDSPTSTESAAHSGSTSVN